ncbi:unnamed protein product [Rotaria socialis]|uniref:Uncharacterized protein n=2 Tax=Rotaria socialis TaxID=392032 RepID=A0A818HN67_9BILA|nr:unnamed protein product [Rotaria socialis]CAF4536866.1 unnamed protein product [Rotaria socialis]
MLDSNHENQTIHVLQLKLQLKLSQEKTKQEEAATKRKLIEEKEATKRKLIEEKEATKRKLIEEKEATKRKRIHEQEKTKRKKLEIIKIHEDELRKPMERSFEKEPSSSINTFALYSSYLDFYKNNVNNINLFDINFMLQENNHFNESIENCIKDYMGNRVHGVFHFKLNSKKKKNTTTFRNTGGLGDPRAVVNNSSTRQGMQYLHHSFTIISSASILLMENQQLKQPAEFLTLREQEVFSSILNSYMYKSPYG